jgi:hypothetical protein
MNFTAQIPVKYSVEDRKHAGHTKHRAKWLSSISNSSVAIL